MPLIADFDQLRVVGLFDIVGAHALEHVAEQVELPVGIGRGRLGAGAERIEHERRLRRHQRQGRARRCTEKNE